MPNRRTFLRATGLTGAAAVLAACGTTDHPTAAPLGAAALTCPPVTPGSVTAETGTLNGWTPGFEDAYALKQGVSFQWQWFACLSSVTGVGVRYPQNKTVAGEKWLLVTLIGGHPNDPTNTTTVDPPPATPEAPFTITLGNPVYVGEPGTPDWRVYSLDVNHIAHNTSCRQTTEDPTAGTVTYTRFDTTAIEGSYDLTFGADHITGTFVAPALDLTGCPARPSKTTCVSG